MLKEEIKLEPSSSYVEFESEVIAQIRGRPIPDIASFIYDNRQEARFHFYYLIYYLNLLLCEYYSKDLGKKKFRSMLHGFFYGKFDTFLSLMTEIYKARGKSLPSSYYFLKDYDKLMRLRGNKASDEIDAYADEMNPSESEVRKLRDEIYGHIFTYRDLRLYESFVREETDFEKWMFSYAVPKLYESYTWTKDKLGLLTQDLMEFFNHATTEQIGTVIDGRARTLIIDIIKHGMHFARTLDQQIQQMRPHLDEYSPTEFKTLSGILRTMNHHFSNETLQKWEQLHLFYSKNGIRSSHYDTNPYNPLNSPSNHYIHLEILRWI